MRTAYIVLNMWKQEKQLFFECDKCEEKDSDVGKIPYTRIP